jgi:hypothetical protein
MRRQNNTDWLESLLMASTLFYAGVVFCLPVPFSEQVANLYPWWGKRIGFGNVQLHELLFLGWVVLYGLRFVPEALLRRGIPTRQAALALIALAVWCGLVSMTAPLAWLDLGRTFRLLVNAALLFAVVRWTRHTGELSLRMLVIGFLTGTIINLILSFQYPLIVYQTLRLSGQNTPGVAMGIAIHLCAWLFLRTSKHKLQALAVFSTVIFAFGCAISYSRVGWFTGGLGLAAWCYILFVVRPKERAALRRLKRVRLVLVPIIVLGLVNVSSSPLGQAGVQWVQILVAQKFSSRGTSDSTRWAYALGTAEIVSSFPLGVGYSGFFDAMRATEVYRSGSAAREVSIVEANPHASFLWYTTAGGVPGGLMAIVVFVLLLNSMRVGLVSAMGRPGSVLFALVALPFLLIGLTVPYLFNSIILIAPAAVAAGWGWSRRLDASAPASSSTERDAKKTLRLPNESATVL